MRPSLLSAVLLTASVASAQVISTNTTWSSNQALSGDVRVEPGVTLTINAGVTVTAAASDAANLGTDSARVELIVRGTLVVNGTAGAPVTFTSAGSGAGAWTGLRVESGGTATVTSAIVEEAVVGLDNTASITVSGSTFRASTWGVRASSGASGTVGTSFFTGNTYGVYGNGGSVTVDHATLVSNGYAVYSAASSGTLTVSNSVVTNNTSYGLYRSSSAVTINNTNDDVWGNGTNYYNTSAGAGSISANPLFVSFGTNHRLTSNSPARFSDSTGGDMGAFAYGGDATPGLTGTLWANTTLSSATVTGDLTIPPGVTVTLPAGATLTTSTSDLMQAGDDSARVELIVGGTLAVTGSSGSPATLTSSGSGAGAWVGVRVLTGGSVQGAGLVAERATTALDSSGTLALTTSTLRNSTWGVRVNASASGTVGTTLISGNTYGVYGNGGSITVDHATLVSNGYAVYSASSSGTLAVNNSLVTNNTSYGLYRSSSAVAIGNTNDDVWGNATNYYNASAGAGSISANPLYVSFGTNYRLTSNSPARFSDSTGTDMGAFPYTGDATSGLTGTLWSNTTLSTATVTGDLTVPPGVTVTIPAGVTLTASTSDLMQAGDDASRVELIVAGTLSVTGTASLPATLTSSGSGAGAWVGVRVLSGGSVAASGVAIERATTALDSAGALSVSTSTLRNNTWGVRTNAGGSGTVGTTLIASNTYGVYGNGGSVTVDHATVVSNGYAVYSASSSGTLAVNNSIITNNTSYGLYRSSSAVTINNSYDDVWGNATNYYNSSAGAGSLSSNPLFVSFGTNYALTANSPARRSDSAGNDLGAFPYAGDATPGLTGTLWTNTALATGTLTGDLVVPSGVTVTVPAGVTLTASTSDLMQAGTDSARVELIVRGNLVINGTAASPALLTSSGSGAGAWVGVIVEAGGSLTMNGTTIERATTGVDSAASLAVTGSTFRNNTWGVRTNAGASGTVGSSLFSGNTYGAYGNGGSLTVDHATMVSNGYAVYSASSSGTLAVNNSLITNNASYGLYRSSSAVSINNSYDDVWGNATNYYNASPGAGSISTNPLYVSFGTNYRLTSNSPARFSDSGGTDMGAFPYTGDATSGLTGTLWTNTTLTTGTVTGDLTVAPGVTVTIPAGVTLTASTSDLMQAGTDASRVELVVRGTLSATGTIASPATLTSSGSGAGAWVGVIVEAGGNASLTGLNVSRATTAVDAFGTVALTDVALTGNTYGVRPNAGASVTTTRPFLSNNTYGAYGNGGALSLDHATIVSNAYGVYSASSAGSLGVTNSIITNNTSYGLYRSSSAVTITNSYDDVWGNSTNFYNSSPGTGSLSANPLFVALGTNHRLTTNSPARLSDSTGGDLGAFAWSGDATPGLVGTLWSNTTLSASATLQGDLTVAPGVTVTLAPGVVLTAPTTDLMQAGDDASRTELIVRGTLQLSGTSANPVVLTSSGVGAGAWVGVRVVAGGSATVTNATITRGTTCLELFGNATVSNSRLSGCTWGVRSNTGTTSSVGFTVLDANTYGAYGQGGALTLDHLTAYANSYGVFSASSTGSLAVTNSLFSNHTAYALYRSSSAVAITNSYNLLFASGSGNTYNTTAGINTLTVDPLLVSPGTGDFHLQSTSPARGAGTSASDLGAFPFAPGPVDRVVVAPASATVAAGGSFTFTATAYDAANNPVPSAVITWTALPAAGVINSTGVLTASCTPGTVTAGVTATSNGRSGSATVTITTAPIASLVVTPSNATVRSQQTQAFTVTALDVCNNPVSSPAITWSVTGSAGIIDGAGLYTAGCSRGTFPMAIVATAGAVTGRASVTVDPGVLSSVSVSPSTATLAINASQQFSGSAADGCGNPLTTSLTWTTSVTGANVSTSGLFTAGTTPGTFTSGVTATATEGSVTRSASSNVTVTGGAVASVMVMPSTASLMAGQTASFSAIALDAVGNVVSGTPTWSVTAGGGSINASTGLFTAGTTAGTFTNTVRATISGVSGFGSVVVQPGAVTRVVVSPPSVTLAPGGNTTFTAQALDTNNNVVTTPIAWSATPASGAITQGGVFTAGTMSGNYPAAVTATANGISGTANVTINAGALAQLTVTPAVATTQAGGTLAFTASGQDGNGNTVPVMPTWSIVAGGGTISPSGVFAAGTMTGTFANTVRAEQNGVTAFATVSVTPGPLVRIDLTPPSADVLVGEQVQFSGAGKDAFGNPVSATFTWTTNPSAGSVTPSGLFTAGMTAGDFADAVRVTSGAISAQASVRVRAPMTMDAGVDAGFEDAGMDAGTETDAGMSSDAGQVESDAGGMTPDAGGNTSGNPGCGCTQIDAFAPLLGLVVLALRRRRS
ncbi:MAG: hypothetical protein ACOZQL_42310 [Myxococcota bacterium]